MSGVIFIAHTLAAAAYSQPSTDGLQLWLDASDARSVVTSADGAVEKWLDESGNDNHAARDDPASRPRLVGDAMNGMPVVRFARKAHLSVPEIRGNTGVATVFIVSQRPTDQGEGGRWQRLLSCYPAGCEDDRKAPAFCFIANKGKSGEAYGAVVDDATYVDAHIGPLTIGKSGHGETQFFGGDIAEILVYDRGFLAEDAYQTVLTYLSEKWNARVSREDTGWTRVGDLGETPKRVTADLPLSDQQNEGDWVRYEPLSDEFDEPELDTAKWWDYNPTWKGRAPSPFLPGNVQIENGELTLTMRKEPVPEEFAKIKGEDGTPLFHDYTSASVKGKTTVCYGYFEIAAKPMPSAGSSSFWFSGRYEDDEGMHRTEIDVFEIGGAAPGFERKYNMNLHVFETPKEKRHWSIGGNWISPWDLADDYHVYGLEWDRESLMYYVDGVLVRKVKNTDWHYPIHMLFDSETMPNWMGMPRDEDLPSTYRIRYVRSWKRRGERQ
jgi:beta-glucanase (GH16 family)